MLTGILSNKHAPVVQNEKIIRSGKSVNIAFVLG